MKTILNIKIDRDLKKKAQKTAKELGIPLSMVASNYMRQFVDQRQITFSAPLVPNKKTSKILRQALKDIHSGKNLSPAFKTGSEMDRYLDSL